MSYKISPIPHGSFSDSTTQTSAGTTSANAITFNTDEIKAGITHSTSVNPSRITVDTAGTYLITFSAIVNPSAAAKHVNIWLSVNGSNVARTNTIYELPASGEALTTVTYIYTFAAGSYFELYWCSRDDANMTLLATAAGINPTTPASPSIILTVNKISK